MSIDAPSQWLTVTEAAIEVGVSASTIRRWINSGDLPAFQPHEGGAVRVPLRVLTASCKEANDAR